MLKCSDLRTFEVNQAWFLGSKQYECSLRNHVCEVCKLLEGLNINALPRGGSRQVAEDHLDFGNIALLNCVLID